jgi:asparagine synthase (glutamine-hydrolysing)
VPIGLFLSGGIDSASLLSLAGPSLTSLTIGFEERSFDESTRAAELAHHFHSKHVAMLFTAERCRQWIAPFLASVDQPSVDGFNTYCVARLAREQGLKVALSGLGGDELFGGYPSFRSIPRLIRWHQRLGSCRRLVAALLSRRPAHRCQRLAAFFAGPATPARAHQCVRGLFAPAEVRQLLTHWGLDGPSPSTLSQSGEPPAPPSQSCFPTLDDQIAWLESSRYMGSQLLRDSDTYSMVHGLELRLPLVDVQLIRRLASIPADQRLLPGKELLQLAVPEVASVAGRVVKRGFTFPFQAWLDQPNSVNQAGSELPPFPSTPAGLDLSPWARRWGLMVLTYWLGEHLAINLPTAAPNPR